MTIYVKNITTVSVPIYNLNLTIFAGDIRKVIADFDVDYVSAKNELDILIDDKKIELINSLGQEVTTSDVFKDVIDQSTQNKRSAEMQTEDTKEERFYYVEDIFCISKGASVTKSFKGYTDTLRISVKDKSIKYRIKSQGVCMPWQYLKLDKENLLNFEYRLKDPSIEILSDAGDCSVNIYMDGYVSDITADNLQNFIDTWYENQTSCPLNNEWYGENIWWNDNKIGSGAWSDWDWSAKVGSFDSKTINLYMLSIGTKITQQGDGARLTIPADYKTVSGLQSSDFKIFKNDEKGVYTIELVEYNDWSDWNPNAFKVTIKNVRYVQFDDQTFDLTQITPTEWDARWEEPHYYAKTGLKFLETNGSFRSSIGSYTVDLNGKPKNITLLFADSGTMVANEPITSLSSGEHDFFIIANGGLEINDTSVITFDNSGTYPSLKIDGVASTIPVYFSDPALNADGFDHFIYSPDGNGGTNILIEDLPNGGDKDFNDIMLNVNFPMTDKILVHTPTTIREKLETLGKGNHFGIKMNYGGIKAYAMGEIEMGNEWCNVWKLRNGSNADLNVRVQDYDTGRNTYYTIPANTDMYVTTSEYSEQIKMEWYQGNRKKNSRPRKTWYSFNSNINLKNEILNTIASINSNTFYN